MNSNLINTISLIKKNKRCFESHDDYIKIITNLHDEISEKNLLKQKLSKQNSKESELNLKELETDIKNIKLEKFNIDDHYKIFNQILLCFNFDSILKIKDINKLVIINPLFELLFVELNLIQLIPDKKYQIQTDPIIGPYDKKYIVNLIRVILQMCDKVNGYKNRAILSIITYDIIFRNFQFVLDYNGFFIVVKNKLDQFKKNEIGKINEVCLKYDLDKDIIDKWSEIINGI
jgi:hypothetical protein